MTTKARRTAVVMAPHRFSFVCWRCISITFLSLAALVLPSLASAFILLSSKVLLSVTSCCLVSNDFASSASRLTCSASMFDDAVFILMFSDSSFLFPAISLISRLSFFKISSMFLLCITTSS